MGFNYKSLISFYTWMVKGLLFVIPFLSLWIASSMFFPYITGRNFGFRILVEIALVFWLGLILLDKTYQPRRTPLFWALIGFLAIIGLADIFGVDSYNSFWSRFERMEGYLMLLHLGAYFVMLSSVLRFKKDWLTFFNIFIIAGFISGYQGLVQHFSGTGSIQGGFRIDGTIGNPTYLAGYLLLVTTLATYLFFTVQRAWLKYLYGATTIFFLIVIYLTASRGPILGLAAAVLLFAVLSLIFGPTGRFKKIAGTVLLLVILLPVGFWAIKDTQLVRSNPVLNRFATLSFDEKTTRARFMVWNMSWQGFKERPILGWGQENYIYVFNKYYNPNMYDQEPWFDRSHSIVFDWLINGGLLGLLSYLSLFGVGLYLLWHHFRSGRIKFTEAAVLTSGLFAYFIQNIFVFDNFNTYIVFFALLAYLNSPSTESSLTKETGKTDFSLINNKINTSLVAAAASLIVIVPIVYFVNIKPWQQAQALIDVTEVLQKQGSVAEVLSSFEKALTYKTLGDREVEQKLGQMAIALLENGSIPADQKTSFVKLAIAKTEKEVQRKPDNFQMQLFAATLYLKATAVDVNYYPLAKQRIDTALKLNPNYHQAYYALAEYYLLANDFTGAMPALRQAVDLAPANAAAQVNLGKVAAAAGESAVVDEVVAAIKSFHPQDGASVGAVADGYIRSEKFNQALALYEMAITMSPRNADLYANLAGLYLNQGRLAEARATALKAAELNPKLYQEKVDQFLKELER